MRRRRIDAKIERNEQLPQFGGTATPHHKKKPEELTIGRYSDKDLDIWADLIKSGICTYEGIANVYQVSVGSLHKRFF